MKNRKVRGFDLIVTIAMSLLSAIMTIWFLIDPYSISAFVDNFVVETDGVIPGFLIIATTSLISALLYVTIKIINRKRLGVFISYHKDCEEIDKIKNLLSRLGNFRVYDQQSVLLGQNIAEEVFKMIYVSSLYIVLFDENYCDDESCMVELAAIIDLGKRVIPILKSQDVVSKLPKEIAALKYLVITDGAKWEELLVDSLRSSYRMIVDKER